MMSEDCSLAGMERNPTYESRWYYKTFRKTLAWTEDEGMQSWSQVYWDMNSDMHITAWSTTTTYAKKMPGEKSSDFEYFIIPTQKTKITHMPARKEEQPK